jgi:hypothetical protein
MGLEFKLSYTANEINEKLGKIDSLATKSEIPTKISDLTNDSGYLTAIPNEYITETELNAKGYLTEHQSLDGFATESYVDSAISAIPTPAAVIYDNEQSLTEEQQALARANIGIAGIITPDMIMEMMDETGAAQPIADADNSVLMTDDDRILIL